MSDAVPPRDADACPKYGTKEKHPWSQSGDGGDNPCRHCGRRNYRFFPQDWPRDADAASLADAIVGLNSAKPDVQPMMAANPESCNAAYGGYHGSYHVRQTTCNGMGQAEGLRFAPCAPLTASLFADEFAKLAKAASFGAWGHGVVANLYTVADNAGNGMFVCLTAEKRDGSYPQQAVDDAAFIAFCGTHRDAILAALRRAEQPDDARVARALAIAAVCDEHLDTACSVYEIVALAEARLKESRNG